MTTINRYDEPKLRTALAYKQGSQKYPGGVLVKAGSRAIRVGDVLSKDTSTSGVDQLVVVKYTKLREAITDSATALKVDDAHAFEVGDEVKVGTLTAQTCSEIDYETNTITLDTAPGTATNADVAVVVETNDADHPVAIANSPLVDKDAYVDDDMSGLVTPRDRDVFYGSAYIRGVFWSEIIFNGNFENGNSVDTAFGGRYNDHNKTYIIDRVAQHYEN